MNEIITNTIAKIGEAPPQIGVPAAQARNYETIHAVHGITQQEFQSIFNHSYAPRRIRPAPDRIPLTRLGITALFILAILLVIIVAFLLGTLISCGVGESRGVLSLAPAVIRALVLREG